MPRSVTLACPAKLNLALAVGRADPASAGGLHPVASWMVALEFADRLTVEKIDSTDADPPASVFSLRYAEDAPRPGVIDWPIEKDLMFRAHGWLEKKFKCKLPVRVQLDKHIPAGAGLGGGSSDAAAVIVALEELFELGLTGADRRGLAAALGSDVHFALAAATGTPSAIVTGSGDEIEAAPLVEPLDVVLVLPPFGCPTGPVYAALDRLGLGRSALDVAALRRLAHADEVSSGVLFNDLAAPAVAVEPALGGLLGTLRDGLGLPTQVTGSGSACFVLGSSVEDAQRTAQRIRERTGMPAVVTRAVSILE